MKCDTVVKKRVFTLRDITEDEGLVLRTLLNLSPEGVREKLNHDKLYWNDGISEDEAVNMGYELCEKVMEMVDGE